MKNKFFFHFFILCSSLFSLFVSTQSFAFSLPYPLCEFDKFCPFAGIEFKGTQIRGRKDWKPLLEKDYCGGNVYVGAKIHRYFGLEFGWFETTRETKTHLFGNQEDFFANGNTTGVQTFIQTRFSGYYLDLNAYYPCFKEYFQVVTAVGIARVRPRINIDIPRIGQDLVPSGFFERDILILRETQGNTRYLPRVGFGVQNYLKDCFGWRIMLFWEETSRLRVRGLYNSFRQQTIDASQVTQAYMDSLAITVGFFVHF